MQGLSTGLPAYLSYLAAKEDAKKAGPEDPSKYMSAVDTMYGGQFERPPEERRIQNLMPTYKAAGGMMGRQPVNGLKAMDPVQYSAMTGQGIMGMAKGGMPQMGWGMANFSVTLVKILCIISVYSCI